MPALPTVVVLTSSVLLGDLEGRAVAVGRLREAAVLTSSPRLWGLTTMAASVTPSPSAAALTESPWQSIYN